MCTYVYLPKKVLGYVSVMNGGAEKYQQLLEDFTEQTHWN